MQELPQYIFKGPLRFVDNYNYEFQTHAKQRWLNKPLMEIIEREFRIISKEFYQEEMANGYLKVNNKIVNENYILKDGDLITHMQVRQETPILNILPTIVFEDDDLLVVNKPPDQLVHMSSDSFHNTLEQLIRRELGINYQFFTVHRLDKMTSGILIIAKNKTITTVIQQQVQEEENENEDQQDQNQQLTQLQQLQQQYKINQQQNQQQQQLQQQQNQETNDQQQQSLGNISFHNKFFKQKIYLARVVGQVDFEEKNVDLLMYCLDKRSFNFGVYEGDKDSNHAKQKKVKTSQTHFKKLWFDPNSNSSLLECRPLTGRTHQIRVHLKHLGFPIINDIKYGGKFYGNFSIKYYFPEVWAKKEFTFVKYNDNFQINENSNLHEKYQMHQETREWDFRNEPREIFLHSYTYQLGEKIFQTEPPYWADKNFEFF